MAVDVLLIASRQFIRISLLRSFGRYRLGGCWARNRLRPRRPGLSRLRSRVPGFAGRATVLLQPLFDLGEEV